MSCCAEDLSEALKEVVSTGCEVSGLIMCLEPLRESEEVAVTLTLRDVQSPCQNIPVTLTLPQLLEIQVAEEDAATQQLAEATQTLANATTAAEREEAEAWVKGLELERDNASAEAADTKKWLILNAAPGPSDTHT